MTTINYVYVADIRLTRTYRNFYVSALSAGDELDDDDTQRL